MGKFSHPRGDNRSQNIPRDTKPKPPIKTEESYGYKILKDMKPYLELSESTLYTVLKRLEAAEMLTVRTAEHDGRLRKYYRITGEGLRRIEAFKSEWAEMLSIYRFVTKEDRGYV